MQPLQVYNKLKILRGVIYRTWRNKHEKANAIYAPGIIDIFTEESMRGIRELVDRHYAMGGSTIEILNTIDGKIKQIRKSG